MVVYLKASNNNRAETVLSSFQEAIHKYNVPSRVRSDLGLENLEVGRLMLARRGLNRGSIITGTSVHNQRIERLWRDVNRIVISKFLNIFLYLESQNILNCSDEIDLFCLHLVYLDIINTSLENFIGQWNNHPVTTENNFSPVQLWIQGMTSAQNANRTAVQDVLLGCTGYNDYGIDEDGPVPIPHNQPNVVEVPPSPINLNDEHLEIVKNVINSYKTFDENGIAAFVACKYIMIRLLQETTV